MYINRRKFLTQSALASAATLIPGFLKGFPGLNVSSSSEEKVLIIIQLSGGNDGLNTVIPFRDDLYYSLRPGISLPEKDIIKIADSSGFNPVLKDMERLFKEGEMCILNNVGYPNPDRSHFRAMDIWQTGSESNEYLKTGWIGRYLDAKCDGCALPHTAVEVDDSLSLALKGNTVNGFAVSHPEKMNKALSGTLIGQLADMDQQHLEQEQVSYLYKVLSEAKQSVNYLYNKSKIYKAKTTFPDTAFGKDLRLISELISSGAETKVYYVSLSGFDTHNNQKNQQERLLKIYSEGMGALAAELKVSGKWNNILVMTFSEFGRRVEQNASGGTDHGKANCVFLNGGALNKPGMYNEMPSLSMLDQGDLQYTIDFRNIYATLLEKWLKADASTILNKRFDLLKI